MAPLFISQFFDALEIGAKQKELGIVSTKTSAVLATGVYILAFILSRAAYWIDLGVVLESMKRFQNSVFRDVMRHSHNFFATNKIGALISKMTRTRMIFSDLNYIFTQDIPTFITLFIASLVVPFWYSWTIGVFFLVWSVLLVLSIWYIKKLFYAASLANQRSKSTADAHLADVISNVITVKSYALGDVEMSKYLKKTSKERSTRWYSWMWSQVLDEFQELFLYGLQAIILFFSLYLWLRGEISIRMIVLVQSYAMKLAGSLQDFGHTLKTFDRAMSSGQELVELLRTFIQLKDPTSPQPYGKYAELWAG